MHYFFKFPIFLALLAFLCLGGGTSCRADSAAPGGTLTMFIPATDWPPYTIIAPGHKQQGVLVDLFMAVAESLGYQGRVFSVSEKRGWDMLQTGGADLYCKAKEWVPNHTHYLWTNTIMRNDDVLYVRDDNPVQFNDIKDLYGMKIGVIKYFVYPGLEAAFKSGMITRVNVTSPYALLEMVALGRIDAALMNLKGTQWMMRTRPELNAKRFRLLKKPVDSAWYRFLFPKGKNYQPLVRKFNQAIQKLKQDGTFKAIFAQYE